MATNTIDQPEPAKSQTSREIAEQSQLAALLTNSKLGARVSGIVLASEEPRCFEGKNQDGSSFKSWSRRTTLFAGPNSGAVIIAQRGKTEEELGQAPSVGAMIDVPIIGARTDGKQMVFAVKL